MPTYLVTAYRWGRTNDHQYQVYAGTDKDKAMESAEKEVAGRGGKYGCAVYEFIPDGSDYVMVGYYPSGDEKAPNYNWRINMFNTLGHELYRYADGIMSVADPDRDGFLKTSAVVPEQWAIDAVKKAQDFATAMQMFNANEKTQCQQ